MSISIIEADPAMQMLPSSLPLLLPKFNLTGPPDSVLYRLAPEHRYCSFLSDQECEGSRKTSQGFHPHALAHQCRASVIRKVQHLDHGSLFSSHGQHKMPLDVISSGRPWSSESGAHRGLKGQRLPNAETVSLEAFQAIQKRSASVIN